LKSYQERWRE